ncbi:hypothetical protein [Chryseobacterium sp.]|uniref:hypothetical protein n=1 Tax=Chryseobacterium sp. TaxID=1871047 RepID=UPI0025BCBD96|nr:hypothetical protein [Chryseobacterium sp.]MBV8328003.1 hypothetical protein [Chryseobacterium sp.]
MEIKIKSNKFIYYKENKFEQFEVKLMGNLNHSPQSIIQILVDSSNYIQFSNIKQVNQFLDEIRGKSKDAFLYNVIKNDLIKSDNFINYIESLNEFSYNSIKSLFLLLNWLSFPLLNQWNEDLSIYEIFFDEFVVDWTNRPEPQKDIYLIKKEYINDENIEMLKHLEKINLLCEISIFPYKNQEIVSYFIPINKLGISKELFEFKDYNGNNKNSYSFWKKILQDRDFRISQRLNNRF